MTPEQFRSATGAPPSGLRMPLEALWWAAAGDWERAHAIVQQDEDDRENAWVHAHLHRVEGDLGNAGYWYRRAGRAAAVGSFEDEREAIARGLIGG